ncbi:MAG: hypothetical protein J6K03_04290, partial [Oscillospiraceae bacterium]|nr:hypothetical protein [Oscillospiraceae bacterium]
MDTKRRNELTEEELAQVRKAMEDFGNTPLTPVVKVETAEEQEAPVKKEEQPVRKRRKWGVWVAVAVVVALVIGIGYGYWSGLVQNHPNSMAKRKRTISVSGSEIVAVLNDGTVYTSANSLSSEMARWKDMVSVSMTGVHAVGLRKDGTVAFAGAGQYGRESSQWTNMAAVSVGSTYTLGLLTDGTVVAAGKNDYGQCEVSEWENIIGIEAGPYFSAGLRADGTVVVTDVVIKDDASGTQNANPIQNLQAELEKVAQWENMISISVGD